MQIIIHQKKNVKIGEVMDEGIVINNASEGLDLLGTLYFDGYDAIIMHQNQLNHAFFELKNGLLGEWFQKFSNYRMRFALIGDFEKIQSKSLNDFIYEINQYGQINFVSNLEEAFLVLER